ncbi:MAG: hypothetical protein OJF48_004640 [Afipia sp.]|nr:MAG: hypothetical protein OJF48_004640 [Afipia sp.]
MENPYGSKAGYRAGVRFVMMRISKTGGPGGSGGRTLAQPLPGRNVKNPPKS